MKYEMVKVNLRISMRSLKWKCDHFYFFLKLSKQIVGGVFRKIHTYK